MSLCCFLFDAKEKKGKILFLSGDDKRNLQATACLQKG